MKSPPTETSDLDFGNNALVDAHHHLWDLTQNHYPWLAESFNDKTFMGDYRALCRNYLPADFRADQQGHRVIASVHIEAEHDRRDPERETRWLEGLHAQQGLPNAIVAYARFDAPDCADMLVAQCQHPLVRGIRCKPLTSVGPQESVAGQAGSLQDTRWLDGLALLRSFGLSWDLRVPYWHLAEAAEVASLFPDTPIALEHAGLPWNRTAEGLAIWRQGMEALARHPNVHVKLSELSVPGQAWNRQDNVAIIREAIAIFGIERSMFASNFPVAGLRVSYDGLVQTARAAVAHCSPAQQQAFFAGNALRFYRIVHV
ncbi:MAG: amidohydrolase family protein [Pseudogulbenkiania sp.]|nr:amidohydrolase family protein [Pseudogulbenkiania sp.]